MHFVLDVGVVVVFLWFVFISTENSDSQQHIFKQNHDRTNDDNETLFPFCSTIIRLINLGNDRIVLRVHFSELNKVTDEAFLVRTSNVRDLADATEKNAMPIESCGLGS